MRVLPTTMVHLLSWVHRENWTHLGFADSTGTPHALRRDMSSLCHQVISSIPFFEQVGQVDVKSFKSPAGDIK